MGLILRSPLVYPGGVFPGYNTGHFAATKKIRYAGVALGGNMVSLLTGKQATISGTITSSAGVTGQAVVNTTASSFMSVSAANETPAAITFAAIFTPTGTPSNGVIFSNNGNANANASSWLLYRSTPAFTLGSGAASTNATFAPVANHSYFVAASYDGSTNVNFVVVDLLTGKTIANAAARANAIGTTTAAQYNIGGSTTLNPMTGNLSAVMYSIDYFSLTQLAAWAAAPWDFWYPPTVKQTIFASLGGLASTTLSFAVTDVVETASFTLTKEDDLHFALTDAVETASFTLTKEDDLSFALTDAVETASFTLTKEDDLSFALTDAVETASFTLTKEDDLSFALTDAVETASFTLTSEDDLHFALTDAVETASFTLTGTDTFHFGLTDAVETAAFTLTGEDDFHFALTDAVETASFQLSHSIIQVPTGHPNRAPRLRERVYRHRLLGRSQDPTIVVTKDRPGPLRLIEVDFWMD